MVVLKKLSRKVTFDNHSFEVVRMNDSQYQRWFEWMILNLTGDSNEWFWRIYSLFYRVENSNLISFAYIEYFYILLYLAAILHWYFYYYYFYFLNYLGLYFQSESDVNTTWQTTKENVKY